MFMNAYYKGKIPIALELLLVYNYLPFNGPDTFEL